VKHGIASAHGFVHRLGVPDITFDQPDIEPFEIRAMPRREIVQHRNPRVRCVDLYYV